MKLQICEAITTRKKQMQIWNLTPTQKNSLHTNENDQMLTLLLFMFLRLIV